MVDLGNMKRAKEKILYEAFHFSLRNCYYKPPQSTKQSYIISFLQTTHQEYMRLAVLYPTLYYITRKTVSL
jgi:hypothetical protein